MKAATALFLVPAFVISLALFDARAVHAQSSLEVTVVVKPGKNFPKRKVLKIPANMAAACGKVPGDDWVVDAKTRGVKWVAVFLKPSAKNGKIKVAPKAAAADLKKVIIDQPACRFIPHMTTMTEGAVLVAKNSSTILHNFKYGQPFNPRQISGNVAIVGGLSVNITGAVADDSLPINIECNIHPWMRGYLWVLDHPYHAVTDEKGVVTLKHVPAGRYRVMAYHGATGWVGGEKGAKGYPITVGATGTTKLKLEITP
ncbi:MAG: hypothetical protein ACFCD0_06620 [Gemmataceae bacterium]